MKGLLGWLAVAWLGCGGASAEDIVIESLDADGNLTFNTISNVQSYRIEWAPADGSPWTNFQGAAEALDAIAATADPSITVEVPFRYRVVASVTNAPPPPPEGEYLVIDVSAGPSASSYPVSSLSAVPPGGWTDEYKTTKLVLRRIPAGTFVMGSPTGELGHGSDETQHTVTLSQDFYIGVFEVTQRQWERVMGDWPSYFTDATYRESRPVERVSYYDIRENPVNDDDPVVEWPSNSLVNVNSFVGKLRTKTGLATLDLPTESQWEYACRAGTTTALNSGYNLTSIISDPRMSEVGRYWYNGGAGYTAEGDTSVGSAKVGSYLPNAWGLYDMHGNVFEWCLDWYDTYPGTVTDPLGAASGLNRVRRGAGWYYYAGDCRSAYRLSNNPSTRNYYSGFRLSRALP